MLIKLVDHTGKPVVINPDNILFAQPGLQKGVTKLIMVGGVTLDITADFDNLTPQTSAETNNATQ